MQKKLTEIFRTATVRHSITTTISIFMSSGLGAVFYLVLAKAIGPHDYGLFSLAIAALSVVMSVSDLGIGQALVKFVGAHRDDHGYFPFVKLSLQIKVSMGILATLVFGLGSAQIAKIIFHQPELAPLLPIVGVAVFCQLLFFLSASIFQGLQKFLHWGGLQVGANLVRLGLLLPLLFFAKLNSYSALFIFTISYFSGFVTSIFWLDLGFIKSTVTSTVKKDFWDFNRWTAVFVIFSSITSRLDTILTGRFLTLSEVGIYALASTMVSFLPQLASAVGAVTTAKFAGIRDRLHEKSYLKKSLLFVSAITIAISILMLPTAYIVVKITGKAYGPAIIPFVILLLGNIIYLASNPVRDSILYFHSKPKFFVFSSFSQGVAMLISGMILIPAYGVAGAALAVCVSQLVSAGLSIGYYFSIKL